MIRNTTRERLFFVLLAATGLAGCSDFEPARTTDPPVAASQDADDVDDALRAPPAPGTASPGASRRTLETRLGRRIDRQLADVGRCSGSIRSRG